MQTLAYLLPILTLAMQRAEEELKNSKTKRSAQTNVHAIIVAPSRELAMQIMRVAQELLPESARRAVQQCIGGGGG